MIANQNEAKIIIKHIQCDCKWKFNSTTCYSYKNEIMKYVNKRVKIIVHARKRLNLESWLMHIVVILAHVFVRRANV